MELFSIKYLKAILLPLAISLMLGGCAASQVQDTGKSIGEIGQQTQPENKDEEDDATGDYLEFFGSVVEMGGLVKEAVDGPEELGKEYETYPEEVQYDSKTNPLGVKIEDNYIFSKDKDGNYYKHISSPYTGRIWHDRNLGAMRVCESPTDLLCYGDYFQWGRKADGHEKYNSYTTATLDIDTKYGNRPFVTSSGTSGYLKELLNKEKSYKHNWS